MTLIDADAAFLGAELRRARIAAGITSQEALAQRLGYERTVIAKAESGYQPPSPEVARAYAREFPQLSALVDSGLIERWAEHVRGKRGTFPEFFVDWVDCEENATALFYWAPTLVPGILQTEAYARAILAKLPSEESLEDRLAGRLARQQVLSRPRPPVVSVVMAEAVLHRCVGGPEVMREQLIQLAENQQPKVLIQVIPAEVGAHAGLEGGVSIADDGDGSTVVYLESLTAGQTTADREIVSKVREITELLRCEALSRSASRELIMKMAEERWPTA
jgi:transcriptional regulator with XRE-family HTH domain